MVKNVTLIFISVYTENVTLTMETRYVLEVLIYVSVSIPSPT